MASAGGGSSDGGHAQIPEGTMEKEKDPVGLLIVIREDQLSLHKKYSTLLRTVDSLSNEVRELREEVNQLKQTS
jgi:hypothetical protein